MVEAHKSSVSDTEIEQYRPWHEYELLVPTLLENNIISNLPHPEGIKNRYTFSRLFDQVVYDSTDPIIADNCINFFDIYSGNRKDILAEIVSTSVITSGNLQVHSLYEPWKVRMLLSTESGFKTFYGIDIREDSEMNLESFNDIITHLKGLKESFAGTAKESSIEHIINNGTTDEDTFGFYICETSIGW